MLAITTACVGFIFVCIIFPHLIRNHNQFYLSFVGVGVILLCEALVQMFAGTGFAQAMQVILALLNLLVFVLLVVSTGGLSLKDLAGRVGGAVQTFRHGEQDKPVVLPIGPQHQKPAARPKARDTEGPTTFIIDEEAMRRPAPPPGSVAGAEPPGESTPPAKDQPPSAGPPQSPG